MRTDCDNPELTDVDFARAKPFREVFPDQHQSWKRLGRPPVHRPKVHVGFSLAVDVVEAIRGSGRGYISRVEKVLRDAIDQGLLRPWQPAAWLFGTNARNAMSEQRQRCAASLNAVRAPLWPLGGQTRALTRPTASARHSVAAAPRR